MKDKKIQEVVDEAVRLIRDYPELTYTAAIKRAKETIKGGENIEGQTSSNCS